MKHDTGEQSTFLKLCMFSDACPQRTANVSQTMCGKFQLSIGQNYMYLLLFLFISLATWSWSYISLGKVYELFQFYHYSSIPAPSWLMHLSGFQFLYGPTCWNLSLFPWDSHWIVMTSCLMCPHGNSSTPATNEKDCIVKNSLLLATVMWQMTGCNVTNDWTC